MKKQIIAIISVAVAAILLFVAYTAFFKDDSLDEVVDPMYSLTDEVKERVADISSYTLSLHGYDVDDEGWVMIRRMASSFRDENKKIKIEEADAKGGFEGVSVKGDGGQRDIEYSAFFKTHYDGTRYAFDGESLIANALFELSGQEALELSAHAFDGYDADGDTITGTGMPFIFPSLDRSNIAYLTVNNSTGSYSVYQDNGTFYYGSSRSAQFDSEQFSLYTTNCRYAVTYGKMDLPEGKNWSDYGLDTDSPATASYTIMTNPDISGKYTLHSVYIGKKSSTGSYYYARYIGGVMEDNGGESKLVANLTKEHIYYFPTDTVEGTIDSSGTMMLDPSLVTPSITSTEALLSLTDIRIEYINENISALVKNLSAFNRADNIALKETSALSSVISDKVHAGNYSDYEGGWTENTGVFGGFTSTDRKPTYIEAALARYSKDGKYSIRFGVLRDEANGAYLPNQFTITTSYDGVNYISAGEAIIPKQDDKTIKQYTLDFESTDRIRYVRLGFDVPQVAFSYVVFDEIRVFAGDEDAQPTDSTSGIWRLVYPDDYIAEGRNFSYLDINNFNNLVQELAALKGDRVVYCGITENGDGDATKLKTDVLDEYGLLNPDKHYAFTYDGATMDIYVSAPDENGVYYAYSVASGVVDNKNVKYTGDIIVSFTTASAEWLDWDFFEILDHSLLSMYIVEIEDLTVSFDGTDYKFILTADEAGSDIIDVSYNGKSFDVKSFKYLYQYMLSIYLQDEYIPEPGETAEEYLRIKVNAETRSPEIVFYRVSSTKCYFTIDGEGSYYALAKSVNAVRDNVIAYINGATITRPQ